MPKKENYIMEDKSLGLVCPQIKLKTNESLISLPDEFKGKWSLVYFYPKDDTPGCTVQACSYRDEMKAFEGHKVNVWGVSSDDVTSHQSFVSKFSLNFSLIVDAEKKLAEALGVKGRDTFLINPDAKVERVWRNVNPKETVNETLVAIKSLVN